MAESLKDLAKKYLGRFKDALGNEIDNAAQTPVNKMIRGEISPAEASKAEAQNMADSYERTSKAPMAALRSAVSEAQAGRAPVPQTFNAAQAPAWSDIAQGAGVQNPNALAAVQTVGDIAGDSIGMPAGVKGAVNSAPAKEIQKILTAQDINLRSALKKMGPEEAASFIKNTGMSQGAFEHILKRGQELTGAPLKVSVKDVQHLFPTQTGTSAGLDYEKLFSALQKMGKPEAEALMKDRGLSLTQIDKLREMAKKAAIKPGFACGGQVKGYADGGVVDSEQVLTPQQEAQLKAEMDLQAAAQEAIPQAEANVDMANAAGNTMLGPDQKAQIMQRALQARDAAVTAADPTLRQEARDTSAAVQRGALNGLPVAPSTVDVPAGSGPLVPQYGQDTVLAPIPQLNPAQAAAEQGAAEESIAQAAEAGRVAAAQKAQNAQAKAAMDTEKAVQDRLQKAEDKVVAEQKSNGILEKNSDWTSTLGKSLAIMLGAYGQGMTGAKNNAVADMLERQVEREIAKRKYDNEHAMALRKAALDESLLKLKEVEAKTDSEYKRGLLQLQRAELQQKLDAVNMQRDTLARISKGGGVGYEDLAALDEKTRERMVQTPSGKFVPVNRAEDAKRLTQELGDLSDAKQGIKRLMQINEEFGNNPLAKLTNRDLVAESNTIQQALKGKLRLDIFGPGVLTDAEQKLANQIIRNPSQISTLASANKSSLETLMRKIDYSERIKLRKAGANVPDSANELKLKQFMKNNKGIKESDAVSILMNTVNPSTGAPYWQDED